MTTIRAVLLLPSDTNVIWYSWTLKYEMFFYALFTLCLFSRSQLVTTFGTACLLAMFVLLAPTVSDHATHAFLSNPIVFEFSLGLGLGVLYNTHPHLFTQRRAMLTAGAVFAASFIAVAPLLHLRMDALMGPMPNIRLLVWGLPAAIIVAWGVGLKAMPGRAGQFLLLLGNASYALYLAHFFVMKVYLSMLDKTEIGRAIPQLILGPIVVAACIAAAIGLHVFYEKPVARFFARRRRQAAAAHAIPRPLRNIERSN
jgi:peptidoglycan/LPS O-acetylase OafA/YrhL